jgi:hypothetical protein
MGCTPSQLENESAATLDWILAIDDTYTRVKNKQIEDADV